MAVTDTWHLSPSFADLSVGKVLLVLSLLYVTYVILSTIIRGIYNVFFHPLRHFPGPQTWIAFPLTRMYYLVTGRLDFKIAEFHEIYGDILRISPGTLCYATAAGWRDIYNAHPEVPKVVMMGSGFDVKQLIAAPQPDHARMRRATNPAFTEKALYQQEPVILQYVDMLIQKLYALSASSETTDMVNWYNFFTFDVIADLAYGKSLNGISNGASNRWVQNARNYFKLFPLVAVSLESPLLSLLLRLFAGRTIRNSRIDHNRVCKQMTLDRINRKDRADRGDFMDYMMQAKSEKTTLSVDELVANADLFMLAGTETTSTLLSGTTYWLLKTPSALRRVTEEVRAAFESDTDITFRSATDKLPYMKACLEEGLRIFPPVPSAFPRKTVAGSPTLIDGVQIPPNTGVIVHQYATYHQSRNFHRPHDFVPERWLPEHTEDPASPFYGDNRAVHKPFGYGNRDCVGRILAYHEMRLLMAKILWHFDMELAPECREWHRQRIMILWEKPPLMVKIKRREM